MEKKVILKKVFHRDKWRMLITFNYDESLVALVKKINSNRYSSTYKSWYADAFHPVKYLFEGQSGGRYSVESVYRVFKQALHRAGIKRMLVFTVSGTVMPRICMRAVWISGIY